MKRFFRKQASLALLSHGYFYSKVRTTLYSVKHSTTGKYCLLAFIARHNWSACSKADLKARTMHLARHNIQESVPPEKKSIGTRKLRQLIDLLIYLLLVSNVAIVFVTSFRSRAAERRPRCCFYSAEIRKRKRDRPDKEATTPRERRKNRFNARHTALQNNERRRRKLAFAKQADRTA